MGSPRIIALGVLSALLGLISTKALAFGGPPLRTQDNKFSVCEAWGRQTQQSYSTCAFCLGYNSDCEQICHWDYFLCQSKGVTKKNKTVNFVGYTGRTLGQAQNRALAACQQRASGCEVATCHQITEEKERRACRIPKGKGTNSSSALSALVPLDF